MLLFIYTSPPTPQLYTPSLHDALPISAAIEDLQRFDYDHLGLCPASAPSGVTDPGTQSFQGLSPVTLNCGSSVVLEEPCTPTVGSVAKASYTCRITNITYTVHRYVVWGDDQ